MREGPTCKAVAKLDSKLFASKLATLPSTMSSNLIIQLSN